MSSYNRMLELLTKTGLYKLDGTTILDRELEAYGGRIDTLSAEIDQLFNGVFVENVTNITFVRFATLYGLPQQISKPLLQDLVKRRNTISNADFTVEGIKRCLESGGITATMSENFATNTVTVTVTEDRGVFTNKLQRNAFIKEILPCHVKVTIA